MSDPSEITSSDPSSDYSNDSSNDSSNDHNDNPSNDLSNDLTVPLQAPVYPPTQPSDTTYSGFVAILGKPNVGKSTLLNTLLGVKVAPITSKPQTTRRGVRGVYSDTIYGDTVEGFAEGEARQLVFVDTPGYHRPKDALGEYMNREVRAAVVDVDVILWVVDLRHPPGDEDKDVARLLRGLDPSTRVYVVGNKLDVAKYPDEALRLYEELAPSSSRSYSLSAQNDPEAVYALRSELLAELAEGPFFFPANIRSDQSREEWAAEIVRESAMTHLRQELPYIVAVQLLEWREQGDDEPLYLMAEVWVERANHRMIVLGKGGSMIREIGRTARKQLEIFLGHKIYLELEVVVHRGWREDPEALRELGYES